MHVVSVMEEVESSDREQPEKHARGVLGRSGVGMGSALGREDRKLKAY